MGLDESWAASGDEGLAIAQSAYCEVTTALTTRGRSQSQYKVDCKRKTELPNPIDIIFSLDSGLDPSRGASLRRHMQEDAALIKGLLPVSADGD